MVHSSMTNFTPSVQLVAPAGLKKNPNCPLSNLNTGTLHCMNAVGNYKTEVTKITNNAKKLRNINHNI